MIRKTFLASGGRERACVTFTLPDSLWADKIHLVGDFNNWNQTSHPFGRNRSGEWSLTITLDAGREYQFRYLCDGNRWLSDCYADSYAQQPDSGCNFIVATAA